MLQPERGFEGNSESVAVRRAATGDCESGWGLVWGMPLAGESGPESWGGGGGISSGQLDSKVPFWLYSGISQGTPHLDP